MLRSLRLHRIIAALVVAFAFLVSSVEVLLPDIHDGDAAAAMIESTGTTCSVGQTSPLAASHVEASGAHHHSDAPDTPVTHHGAHVDHCAHSHFVTLASVDVHSTASVHLALPVSHSLTLTSVDLPPHKRPPIA